MIQKTATIYNIQRFSIHDGPGIRTVVFFKGCNLRCKWCHNPESISSHCEIEFYPERCIGCGSCFTACKHGCHVIDVDGKHCIDRNKCTGCMDCANSCYAEAIVGVGNKITTIQLMESILTDKLYYHNSGGGVTFSGGEAMLNPTFLADVMTECKANSIHTAIDTAGNVPFSNFEQIIELTDLFLYDIKAFNPDVHKRLTGATNKLILENLEKLKHANKKITVRVPYIPELNGGEMSKIASYLKALDIRDVEVLGFHKLGDSKYSALGLNNPTVDMSTPTQSQIDEIKQLF